MRFIVSVILLIFLTNPAAGEPPVIHTPVDEQHIGGEGDRSCPAGEKCWRVHASGWVPEDREGVFAVEPLHASPAVWVQQFVRGDGGNVRATVYLGQKHVGAREYFRIYLLSCQAGHGLIPEETSFEEIDKVCVKSAPVTVYRER